MLLTDEEKKMLDGQLGPAVQKAMQTLVEYGDCFGAERMVSVNSVHCFPWDPYELLSDRLEGAEQVKVLSTLHSIFPAQTKWATAMGIDETFAEREAKTLAKNLELFEKVGFFKTFTCAPYLIGNVLRQGSVFSWPGSSGIVVGNSLFGGRGNRDSSIAAISSALTGLLPEMELLKREKRYAQVMVELDGLDLESFTPAHYGALGYYLGGIAGRRNIVINGMPKTLSFEQAKFLMSPLQVSGAVSLCHVVGVTPEASTLEEALGHSRPQESIAVNIRNVEEAWEKLSTADSNEVDLVWFGCPHCSIREIKEIASLLMGKKLPASVGLWVATADGVYALAERMGYVDIIKRAGGLVVTDVCLIAFPFGNTTVPIRTVATNSARAAHYFIRGGLSGVPVRTLYGSVKQCISAALKSA